MNLLLPLSFFSLTFFSFSCVEKKCETDPNTGSCITLTSTAGIPEEEPTEDRSAINGQQSYSMDLPDIRDGMDILVVGSNILFAGGSNPTSDRFDILDMNTKEWTALTLPQKRYGIRGAVLNNVALFAGGAWNDNSSHIVDDVDIYDCSVSPCVQSLSHALVPVRHSGASVTLGTKAIFAGGWEASAVSDDVSIYEAGAWAHSAGLSVARGAIAATVVEDRALFAGGTSYDVQTLYNTVDIYNCSTDPCAWSTATLSQARMFMGATTVGKKALFAGGQTTNVNTSRTNRVDIYDCTTACAWSTATLPSASGVMIGRTVGTKAIFVDEKGNTDIYDLEKDTWYVAPGRPRISYKPSAFVYGTKLFVGAGFGDNGLIDVFDTATDTWSEDLVE
jgi:hypothetical protein